MREDSSIERDQCMKDLSAHVTFLKRNLELGKVIVVIFMH